MTNTNKYSKTWLYKIVCKDETIKDCYVGHTTNFTKRISKHKYNCFYPDCKEYNYRVYEAIREHGGWNNWDMRIIETGNFNSKEDALQRERDLIQILEATLNCAIPGRTKAEWRAQNAEAVKQHSKSYRDQNKDKIKERRKSYRDQNKDKIKEQRKSYRDQNKDKIKEHSSQPYICTYCNCTVRLYEKSRHNKTKKHQEALELTNH